MGKPELEQQLQQALGQPVHLQALEGDWRFLFPVVRLRQLDVGSDGALGIARVEVELDPAMSLYHWLPVFRRIEVDGVSAYLSQQEDGWYLENDWRVLSTDSAAADDSPSSDIPSSSSLSDENARPVWLKLLELQQNMEVSDWLVLFESDSGNVDQLHVQQLLWRHRGDSQSVTGDLSWGRKQFARTRISALLHGQLWPWSNQSGKVFLDVEPQSWASWMPELPASLSFPKLDAGAAVWLTLENGNLKHLFADVVVDQLKMVSASSELSVQQGRIQVAGKHRGKDWHLKVAPELGGILPLDSLSISSIDLRGRQAWQLGIPELRFGEARSFLVDHTLLPDRIHRYLANLKPEGLVEGVRVSVLPGEEWQTDVRARARDVSMQTYRGIPGISNVAGEIHLSPRLGRFDFRDQSPQVFLSGVYDKPWRMDTASGTF